jgi:predicted nucleotidyltransferase
VIDDESRKARAIAAVQAAEAVARRHGWRLAVFGSLATGRFDGRSDIDLATYGVEGDTWKMIGAVTDAVELYGFECDVIDMCFVGERLRAKIERDGRRVAEFVTDPPEQRQT